MKNIFLWSLRFIFVAAAMVSIALTIRESDKLEPDLVNRIGFAGLAIVNFFALYLSFSVTASEYVTVEVTVTKVASEKK